MYLIERVRTDKRKELKTMKKFHSITVLAIYLLFTAMISLSPALVNQAHAEEKDKKIWNIRCNEPKEGENKKRGRCEAVQRLVVAETGQLFSEFAIGFPDDSESARGVIIVPLGVLLEPGLQFKIDENDPYKVGVRYCSPKGCFAYLNIDNDVLSLLKKGNEASIFFVDTSGKKIQVKMSLMGLTKALKEID